MSEMRSYLLRLVSLCQALAAIGVSQKAWVKYAPKSLRNERDNMKCRWALEDQIRKLLRENGDFPHD